MGCVGGGFPRDGLDLDGYRLRADFSRVFASEVTEDLKVSVSSRVIIIKPARPTFYKKEESHFRA